MTNALRMYVCQASEQLVHIKPNKGARNGLLALGVLPGHFVHGLRDEFQDEVQVNLIFFLPRGIEEVHEFDNVAMFQPPHDLKLTVLEPLILQNFLYGNHFTRLTKLGLIYHTKTTIANDL